MRELIKDSEFYFPYWRAGYLVQKFLPQYNPYTEESLKSKSIFLHVPKTAGSSISMSVFGGRSFHYPAGRYYLYNPKAFNEFFKFSFVRNPFDRMLSAYTYLATVVGQTHMQDGMFATEYLQDMDNFSKFVLGMSDAQYRKAVLRYIHFRPQTSWMTVPNKFGPEDMDFIGRFEALDEGLDILASRISLKGNMPHLRPSVHAHYKDVYTHQMRTIVEDIYARDLKNFGYKF